LKYCWSRLYCVLEFSMQFLLGKTKTKYLRLTLKVYGILDAFDNKKQKNNHSSAKNTQKFFTGKCN